MVVHNLLSTEAKVLANELVLTAATTLTLDQINAYGVFILNNASGIAITLPAASEAYAGKARLICNKGAGNCTVAVTAGYGGAGSADTITLAQGNMALIFCDGSYFYALHHTTGG